MNNVFYQAISLFPGIALSGIVAYFYIRLRQTGLLLMLIASLVLTVVTAFIYYLPLYMADRALSAAEMQQLYTKVGIVSLVAQTLLAVGLALVLSRYPIAKNEDSSTSF